MKPFNIWCGTDESYFASLEAMEQAAKLVAAGPDAIKAAVMAAGGGQGGDPFALPPVWQKQGSLAVMDISGSMVNGNAGFARLFGAIGYADIQQGLAQIAMDKEVKAVLLNVDSDGGQVDGLTDTADMIQALDTMKPVMSFASGTMGSAAYWLGSSARSVAASTTSQVGSVGVVAVHTERSKARADAGLKDTVIRSGEFKALGNAVEPLSDAGKAQLQALVNESGRIFVNYAAQRRGMTAEAFQKTAGEGRVFMGQQAKDVGLVDTITNMTGAINAAKSLDNAATRQQNPGNSRKGLKMKLSKKTILAIAAGIALDQLGLAEPTANLEGIKLEGDALALAEVEAKEVSAAIETRVAAAVETAKTELGAQTAELKAKLETAETAAKAATDKVALAEAAANDFKAKLETSAGFGGKASEIVKASLSNMLVALGGTADAVATMTGSELLAEHDKVAELFKKKFPAGGVAAVAGAPKVDTQLPAVSPVFRSLVKPVVQ